MPLKQENTKLRHWDAFRRNSLVLFGVLVFLWLNLLYSCDTKQPGNKQQMSDEQHVQETEMEEADESDPVYALLVLPDNPAPGEPLRIVATGGRNLRKAKIIMTGPSGEIDSQDSGPVNEGPGWRIVEFAGAAAGTYSASLMVKRQEVCKLDFEIGTKKEIARQGRVWVTQQGWDQGTESLYSAWIHALFQGCDEQSSWPALHEVTRNRERNFLYNHLGLGEDDPASKNTVLMEPDCADNPFFLRAYFAWKLGLPFGYHVCDRGWMGRSPRCGQWVTHESSSSKSDPVQAFNSFVRRIMDGVHSGTARTALDNENSDFYPVALDAASLRPGTVFADPYGHTFILINRIPQTRNSPGLLLAVDAQPDNTIAIKRFWRGNFLFNTVEVIGEPGFKAFRPIVIENDKMVPLPNAALNSSSGFVPFSIQQKNMSPDDFYLAMDRLINPSPLDPEEALTDLITALHEQLQVRVKSVANGVKYFNEHPGAVISMPSSANGVFLTGGPWEDYSTPNRDLRLLIAIDAVLGFPDRVAQYPGDFKVSWGTSPEEIRTELQRLLEKQVAELKITYTRSDGSAQELNIAEILARREAFEMAYNPNDCPEIRWGAPEGSAEHSTCRRLAPPYQKKTMQDVRKWFTKRLHPPT